MHLFPRSDQPTQGVVVHADVLPLLRQQLPQRARAHAHALDAAIVAVERHPIDRHALRDPGAPWNRFTMGLLVRLLQHPHGCAFGGDVVDPEPDGEVLAAHQSRPKLMEKSIENNQ